jgi:hypothetical protein
VTSDLLTAHPAEWCAICLARTQGPVRIVRLTHGIGVYLCHTHAGVEFRTARHGRDFVLALQSTWTAAGCLSTNRIRALDAHLAAVRRNEASERSRRPRPGSYTWKTLQVEAVERAAAGEPTASIVRDLVERTAGRGEPLGPSPTTIRRWIRDAFRDEEADANL